MAMFANAARSVRAYGQRHRLRGTGPCSSNVSVLSRCMSTDSRKESYDVVVVGGGLMGAWTAARAASKGASVALVEQYTRDNSRGSSHGDGRIWRKAYQEDLYVDMMELSLTHWYALEERERQHGTPPYVRLSGKAQDDGPRIIMKTGLLVLSDSPGEGRMFRLDSLKSLFERRGLRHESLDAAGVRKRFPGKMGFGAVPDGIEGLWLEEAGAIFATPSMQAIWRHLETDLGVKTFENTQMLHLAHRSKGDQLDAGIKAAARVVPTGGGAPLELHAKQGLVLAPGGWLTETAREHLGGMHIETRVTAEVVSYHKPVAAEAHEAFSVASDMPVFVADVTNGVSNQGYYGLPMIDIPGVKVSAHHGGAHLAKGPKARPLTAGGLDSENTEAVPQNSEDEAARQIQAVVDSNSRLIQDFWGGDLEAKPFKHLTCLYTNRGSSSVLMSGSFCGSSRRLGA
eukprot:TRINITY_DN11666_c0_g1_i2.p1 TRINITY_DN11666_c0_g1~~TRINITY_DN11666_c0_g1_i2.p1  ORF type:complete len:456 (+),score=65.97 TRINITY_DN11666_c0_g1_i2:52-1419(+)